MLPRRTFRFGPHSMGLEPNNNHRLYGSSPDNLKMVCFAARSDVDCVDCFWWRGASDLDMVMALSLQDFIVRARVLKLYRQTLRATKRAPSPAKAESRQTIRLEMELNRGCNDKQTIRFLISEGLERIKRFNEMLDMQGHHS